MPSLKGCLFFFIVFSLFLLLLSQKYDINTKTTTSPFSDLPEKHIYQLASSNHRLRFNVTVINFTV